MCLPNGCSKRIEIIIFIYTTPKIERMEHYTRLSALQECSTPGATTSVVFLATGKRRWQDGGCFQNYCLSPTSASVLYVHILHRDIEAMARLTTSLPGSLPVCVCGLTFQTAPYSSNRKRTGSRLGFHSSPAMKRVKKLRSLTQFVCQPSTTPSKSKWQVLNNGK